MSEAENSSLASLISSLSESFRTVPPTAIPPVLDCVLASTGISPSTIFASLFDHLVDLVEGDKKLDSESCSSITGMLVAVCHLLNKVGANHAALRSFMWRSFLPVVKMGHELDHEFLNQVTDLFFGVVEKTNAWDFLKENLIPFLLRSASFSDAAVGDKESDTLQLEMPVNCGPINNPYVDKDYKLHVSESLPLSLSCFLLRATLDAALSTLGNGSSGDLFHEGGSCSAEELVATLLWDLWILTEHLLLKSSEQRSCTIGFLIPIILKFFASQSTINVPINGKTHLLSRNSFFMKIWSCCRTLFSLGSSERRDAYGLLSLYMSFISSTEISTDAEVSDQPEVFDIKTVKEFWNEMKKGLMSNDGLVRKQSLHILKTVLCIEGMSQFESHFSESKTTDKHSVSNGTSKRDLWAEKEARSLGVGRVSKVSDLAINSRQQWEAFLLLYEMLEEYGTHLVEAAWSPQITLLLQFSVSDDNFVTAISRGAQLDEKEITDEALSWLSILWKRGFFHDNPLVRCMILQSFLGIDWEQYECCANSMPESFVLGPFLDALDDPVHHSDFGVKEVYSSKTIEGAVSFIHQFARGLDMRRRIAFSWSLAALTKKRSFSRPGLMSLAECIASVGLGSGKLRGVEAKCCEDAIHDKLQEQYYADKCLCNDKEELLGVLRYVIESSKQHFNPSYRLRVCKDVLTAVASLVYVTDVSLETVLHFISAIPREFTDNGGELWMAVRDWLSSNKDQTVYSDEIEMQFLEKLCQYPSIFIFHNGFDQSFDDEDLNAWELEAKRWTRVLFFVGRENLAPILKFIQNCSVTIFEQNNQSEHMPIKFLILISCLIHEIEEFKEGTVKCVSRSKQKKAHLIEGIDHPHVEASTICKKFTGPLLLVLEKLLPFTYLCCSVFSEQPELKSVVLPSSVRGRLGGPSQRRLPNFTTASVLKAIVSVKVVACISRGYAQYACDSLLRSVRSFLWGFFQETVSCTTCNSETEAEVRIAAYEALVLVLKALMTLLSPEDLHFIRRAQNLLPIAVEGQPLLDSLVLPFLQNVNDLLSVGVMVRTRRAVLINWKWLCLESLLSSEQNRLQVGDGSFFFSDAVIRHILTEVTESLENAGEVSVLPMLRSLRMALELVASRRIHPAATASEAYDNEIIWKLVRSSWILHVSCSKRRVAPIAALLSSILHLSLFGEEDMHVSSDEPGPLKWFVGRLIEEGTKSPRTIRLAALHLTGLWLLNPWTLKYYLKELKLLTLYGSVAFDEDFEAELAENRDSRIEVSFLGKSPDSELTEAYINTELYARVSVAVLFQKLADLSQVARASVDQKRFQAGLASGKLFLLDLMDSVVNDKDLGKELYKKFSAIHRRKVRAWQMICVLSSFVGDDIVEEVTQKLHIALYRSNLPGVRQYLETFGINIFLKFPLLVGRQLIPILRDYDMRPQALASYVFIAANVMLHAPDAVKFRHLDELFPPIIPFLTSHHHSLRGFTQVLVHQVLRRFFPNLDSGNSAVVPLEKKCFHDLKFYLEGNSDCARLRSSMEGYLDAYDPVVYATPAGIFVARFKETEFECVPTSLMEHVLSFLNDAREGLRSSMAKDTVTIKNESFDVGNASREQSSSLSKEKSLSNASKELMLDYQKKFTLSKHDKENLCSSAFLGNKETYKQLLEMEKEDDLLDQLLKSRNVTMEKIRGKRQPFILVASLLDRVPNLAGLARTCEVFGASGLAVADANIIHDKQFQLISVTAEKWVPITEVPVNSVKLFLERKKREGFSILGLEQTANSIPLDKFIYPKKTVMVLGREKEGIPADVIHMLDACIEIPQLGVVRSLNVHVSGAIALWEYTRQQRSL